MKSSEIEQHVVGWGAEVRPMLGMRAYLSGGRMFAAAGAPGLLLKLPPEQRQALLDSGEAQVFLMGSGAAFGEWVALAPGSGEQDEDRTRELLRASYDYVTSAPPPAKPPREQRRFRKRQY